MPKGKRSVVDDYDFGVVDTDELPPPAELPTFTERTLGTATAVETPEQPPTSEPETPKPPATSRRRSKKPKKIVRPPRIEITADAETVRMLKELERDLQMTSDDGSKAEVVKALIRAAHAARPHFDYSGLQPRGQWGSASANAFQADLKKVYARGVAEHGGDADADFE